MITQWSQLFCTESKTQVYAVLHNLLSWNKNIFEALSKKHSLKLLCDHCVLKIVLIIIIIIIIIIITYTKPWNKICIITVLYPAHDHPLIIYSQDTLFMMMDAIWRNLIKTLLDGTWQRLQRDCQNYRFWWKNSHEGPCWSVVQRKLRRKQRRRAQRGNEREKTWPVCNVINFI